MEGTTSTEMADENGRPDATLLSDENNEVRGEIARQIGRQSDESSSQKVKSEKKTRVFFTREMDDVLLDTLLEATRGRVRPNNGFKIEVYNKAAIEVSKKAGEAVGVTQLRNRLDLLKGKWATACSLIARSGWRYSAPEQKIKADFSAWEAEVSCNPKSAQLRNKQLYWFDRCNELWHGQVATGQHAFGSTDTPLSPADEPTKETPLDGELCVSIYANQASTD